MRRWTPLPLSLSIEKAIHSLSDRLYIAIDGGGTGTRAGLYDSANHLLAEATGPATNPTQIGFDASIVRIASLCQQLLAEHPSETYEIVIGLSGARTDKDRDYIAIGVCGTTKAERVVVTTDIHAQLLGNADRKPTILVVAGTGSSVAVFDDEGSSYLLGGRGPILGDDGSAYHLVVSALRYGCTVWDAAGGPPEYVNVLAKAAGLSAPEDFVGWSMRANKSEIAALAPNLLRYCDGLDTEMNEAMQCLVSGCLMGLAGSVVTAVRGLEISESIPIYLSGGMFEASDMYVEQMKVAVSRFIIKNPCMLAPVRGHRAVLQLAHTEEFDEDFPLSILQREHLHECRIPAAAITAQEFLAIDTVSPIDIVHRMQEHDLQAANSVVSCEKELTALVESVADAFRHGGRLVYIGAGTSGRLGVLDASECPPTFGVSPEQVIGIMAGGDRALRDSVEGAEDDPDLGRADIEKINPPIGKDDVVVGIAASGTTPYTLGAIATAKALGASTAMVCCNPNTTAEVDYLLVLPTGIEVLPGSTRLKAGTATKMVLNTITTGAMALSGRVFEGYMIGVQPTNAKLRKRAAHIISVLTGINEDAAAHRLEEAGNDVAVVVMMERLKIPADNARELLIKTRGDVRAAIAQYQSDEMKGGDC